MRRLVVGAARVFVLGAVLSGCAFQPKQMTAFDGHWTADIPVQGRCPAAHWDLDVKGSDITGTAKNPAGTFVMTGTLSDTGKGTIRINANGGTIQFTAAAFESDYSNTCGPRHASGTRAR